MMSTAVEILYGDNAEARKALLKLFEFIAGEHIIFPALGTPRHDEMILAPSPNIRPTANYEADIQKRYRERSDVWSELQRGNRLDSLIRVAHRHP